MTDEVHIVVRSGGETEPDFCGVEFVGVYDDGDAATKRLVEIVTATLWQAQESDLEAIDVADVIALLNPHSTLAYEAAQEIYRLLCGEDAFIGIYVKEVI